MFELKGNSKQYNGHMGQHFQSSSHVRNASNSVLMHMTKEAMKTDWKLEHFCIIHNCPMLSMQIIRNAKCLFINNDKFPLFWWTSNEILVNVSLIRHMEHISITILVWTILTHMTKTFSDTNNRDQSL